LNGSAVSGETSATYTLATPSDADEIYVEMTPSAQTCLASNAATASNTVTLTSKNKIWAYPGKQPIKHSIAVLPELNETEDLSFCIGICSDHIEKYKA
jgi:hypothetical protein